MLLGLNSEYILGHYENLPEFHQAIASSLHAIAAFSPPDRHREEWEAALINHTRILSALLESCLEAPVAQLASIQDIQDFRESLEGGKADD